MASVATSWEEGDDDCDSDPRENEGDDDMWQQVLTSPTSSLLSSDNSDSEGDHYHNLVDNGG